MILTVLIIVALKAIQVNEQGLFLGKLSALERIPVKGPDYPD